MRTEQEFTAIYADLQTLFTRMHSMEATYQLMIEQKDQDINYLMHRIVTSFDPILILTKMSP